MLLLLSLQDIECDGEIRLTLWTNAGSVFDPSAGNAAQHSADGYVWIGKENVNGQSHFFQPLLNLLCIASDRLPQTDNLYIIHFFWRKRRLH